MSQMDRSAAGGGGAETDYDNLSKQDLIRQIKTRDVELNHMRKTHEKNAFDPSIFLNSRIRDIFWDKVKNCEQYSAEKFEMKSKYQSEAEKHIQLLAEKNQMLTQLQKEAETFTDYRNENANLQMKIMQLEKELRDKSRREEELHSQNHHLTRANEILQMKVDEYERRIDKVEKHFIEEKEEYARERKKLAKRMQKKTAERSYKRALLKITSEFKASEIFYSNNSQYNIEQIILRFNTLSAESTKYSEMLELIGQFHELVLQELKEIKEKGVVNKEDRIEKDKVENLLSLLTSSKMCNNYAKGLLSKELSVFKNTIEFLISLGSQFLEEKHELFENDLIVSRLCQDLRDYKNFEAKKKVLYLVTEMITHSEKFTKTFVALGGVQILVSEFLSYKDPVFINSEYFCHLLLVLKRMLPNEQEFSDFVNTEVLSYFVKLLSECYNKNSLFEILQILNFLASKSTIRKRLLHLKIFKKVIKFYEDSWKNKDFKLLFYVFLLMGKFTREEGFKLQLISHFEIQNDVSTLFEPFKEENSHLTTEEIKCATLEIIRNLVMPNSPQKMREVLVKSSFLKSSIQACMSDESNMLKNLALDCLISVKDFVIREVMKLDDIIINLERLYDTKDSVIQSKTLLFLCWGLQNRCIDKAIIKQELIIKVANGSILSLEVGEANKYRKEFLSLYLMLDEVVWRETIMSIKYFENLVIARIAKNKHTVKAWLNCMTLVIDNSNLNVIFKANPNYIKFVWTEISEHMQDYTLEVMLLVRACIGVEAFRVKMQDGVFVSSLLSSFVNEERNIGEKNDTLIFICYEVVHYLCTSGVGKDVILRNRGLHDCIRRRLRETEEVCKIIVRLLHHTATNYLKTEIDTLFDRELIVGINALVTKIKEYDIGGHMIEMKTALEGHRIVIPGDIKIDQAILEADPPKVELGTRFKPRLILCEDLVDRMMDNFKRDYIDSTNNS